MSALFTRGTTENKAWGSTLLSIVGPALLLIALLVLGREISVLRLSISVCIVGAMALLIVLILRQDQVAVTLMVALHIYVDWYQGLSIVGQGLACALLIVFFFARSSRHPWAEPRALWLWLVLLVLAAAPSIRGATTLHDAAYYYPNVFIGALVAFWLGTVMSRDYRNMRTLFEMLAIFGALMAIVTLVEAKTGMVLFGSSRLNTFLAQVSNFQLANSTAHRTEAYLINPDWNGTFFCLILFLPLGLFTASTSLLKKVLFLSELFLMLLALLATYSIGAWVGTIAGMFAFVLFMGRNRYRVLMLSLLLLVVGVILAMFPTEVHLQLQHASNPVEVSLRSGAWQTAIRVIEAFPLTGVGLGLTNYMARAEPYRVVAQYIPLAHPHNSYLELGAMAGLPVLFVFVLLILFNLWRACRNWLHARVNERFLLAGGIAAIVALSVNSLSINGWTLPPIAEIGWLILGAMSSPLLMKRVEKRGDEQM